MKNPLHDKSFLKELDNYNQREIYAKISLLDDLGNVIDDLTGRATGGSISVDGNSAVRRTCSVSLIAQNLRPNEYYWGLQNKFKLEIGMKNFVDTDNYPEIIWFPQGIYVITSFNTSQSLNQCTINIQGKDKMVFLNGELGGAITSLTFDFGKEDYIQGDITTTYQRLLKDIILDAVHDFGKEQLHNIVIEDLDDQGVELMRYKGLNPMYLAFDVNSTSAVQQIWFDKNSKVYSIGVNGDDNDDDDCITLDQINENDLYKLFELQGINDFQNPREFYATQSNMSNSKNPFYIAKINPGQNCGYKLTDLVYAGELISNVGESVTSMLDKIVKMLGNFEYFYNLDGKFVFRRKPISNDLPWNKTNIELDAFTSESYYEDLAMTSTLQYSFEDTKLLTAVSNSPALTNIKNDFSIWGQRTSSSGAVVPIHMRYAIDNKPQQYRTYWGDEVYTTRDMHTDGIKEHNAEELKRILNIDETEYNALNKREVDWREIIYQMAMDYRQYNRFYDIYTQKTLLEGYLNNYEKYIRYINLLAVNATRSKMKQWYTKVYHPLLKEDGKTIISANLIYYPKDYLTESWGEVRLASKLAKIAEKIKKTNFSNYKAFLAIMEEAKEYFTTNLQIELELWLDYIYPAIDNESGLNGSWTKFVSNANNKVPFDWGTQRTSNQLKAKELNEFKDRYLKIFTLLSQEYPDDFITKIKRRNPTDCPTGETGYEQYYTDMEGFWRQLYEPQFDNKDNSNYKDFNLSEKQYYNLLKINNKVIYQDEILYVNCGVFSDYRVANSFSWQHGLSGKDKLFIKNVIDNKPAIYIENLSKIYFQYLYDTGKQIKIYKSDKTYVGININNDDNNIDSYNKLQEKLGSLQNLNIVFIDETNITTYRPIKYANKGFIDIFTGLELNETDNKKTEIFVGIINNEKKTESSYYIPYEYFKDYSKHYQKNTLVNENQEDKDKWWNIAIIDQPELLNFWFDFLDTGTLSQFSVKAIGCRPKAVNDTNIKAIYYSETPNIVYVPPESTEERRPKKDGYTYINLTENSERMFTQSSSGKSAKDVVDEYLYQYAQCAENISLTCLPIYYLEPNTRIFVYDKEAGINGEYLMSKFTLPLASNGTMQITASKAMNKIY